MLTDNSSYTSEQIVFCPDLKVRKKILLNIVKNNRKWKVKIIISYCLCVFAISILVLTGVLLAIHPTTAMGIFVNICCSIGFSCIPFLISRSLKNTASYKCALPFSSYANGTLFLYKNRLEYVFWCVGPTEPAAYSSHSAVFFETDKFVYTIDKRLITDISINDKDVCNIKGNGRLLLPKFAEYDKSETEKIESDFSFLVAFNDDNAKNKILKWMYQ